MTTPTLIPTPDVVKKAWDDARAAEKRVRDEAEKDVRVAVAAFVDNQHDALVEKMTAAVCRRLCDDASANPLIRTIFIAWPDTFGLDGYTMSARNAGLRSSIYHMLVAELFDADVAPKFLAHGWLVSVLRAEGTGMHISVNAT